MKLPESLFSRILLAYLPFMGYAFNIEQTWLAAVCVTLIFWVTVFFFWFTRWFFPERFRNGAFFFWLLVWAQAAWYLMKLQPFWVISIFFLTPVSFLNQEHKASRVRVFSKIVPRYFWERFLTGFGFLVFVIVMAVTQEILAKQFSETIFQQPAGIFLLLSAAAFLWKMRTHPR